MAYLCGVSACFQACGEEIGLDPMSVMCINVFTFVSRWSPRHGPTPQRCKDPSAQGTRLPEPARGDGARRAVPVERVLRPARPAAGQVRDAAPGARGRHLGEPGGRQLRRLPTHLVSGAARLRSGRTAGTAAGPAGTAAAPQAHRRGGGSVAGGEGQTAGTGRRRSGRAGAGTLRRLGPSPQHRPRPGPGKKR